MDQRNASIILILAVFVVISLITLSHIAIPQQETGPVIIASTENHADALISAPVSTRLGIPILLTKKNQIPDSTQSAVEHLNPEKIFLIGGPEVISLSLEEKLNKQGRETIRLWNLTQIGTSIKLSQYFWPKGSQEVIIVQYPAYSSKENLENGHLMLGSARNPAMDHSAPILISKEGRISKNVLEEVERLDAEKAILLTMSAKKASDDLKSVGIEKIESEKHMPGRNFIENPADMIQHRWVNAGDSPLVVSASQSKEDVLAIPSLPDAGFFWFNRNGSVLDPVSETKQIGPKKVIVTGDSGLADNFRQKLKEKLGIEPEVRIGKAEDVAAEMVLDYQDTWQRKQKSLKKWRKQIREDQNQNRKIRERLESLTADSPETSQKIKTTYSLLKVGKTFEAHELYFKIISAKSLSDYRKLSSRELEKRIKDTEIRKHIPSHFDYRVELPETQEPFKTINSNEDFKSSTTRKKGINFINGSASMTSEYGARLSLRTKLSQNPSFLHVKSSNLSDTLMNSEIKLRLTYPSKGRNSRLLDVKNAGNTWNISQVKDSVRLQFVYGRSNSSVVSPKIAKISFY